jgi:tetratricopeptide (TPR) repeat protein
MFMKTTCQIALLALVAGGWGRALAQTPEAYFPNEKADSSQVAGAMRQNAEQIHEHATKLFDRGRYRAAAYYFDRLIELRPQEKAFWLGRGQCREGMDEVERAISDYTEALRLDANFVEALFNRAMLYYSTEKYGFAVTDFAQLLTIPGSGPTNTIYYGSSAGQLGGVSQVMTLQQNRQAPIHHFLGLCKLKTADYEGALASFEQAVALLPNEATYWVNRGLAHQHLGRAEQAVADFRHALMLDPDNGYALYNLSQLTPEGQKQLGVYDQVLAHNPNFAPALANRGYAKYEQGDFAGALADFDRAIALGQHNHQAYLNRGLANTRLGKYAEAVKDFGQALQLDPNSAKAYAGRGSAYFHLKILDRALADYNLAIAFSPNEAHLYYNRGLVFRRAKQMAQACADIKKAVEMGWEPAERAQDKLCH